MIHSGPWLRFPPRRMPRQVSRSVFRAGRTIKTKHCSFEDMAFPRGEEEERNEEAVCLTMDLPLKDRLSCLPLLYSVWLSVQESMGPVL